MLLAGIQANQNILKKVKIENAKKMTVDFQKFFNF